MIAAVLAGCGGSSNDTAETGADRVTTTTEQEAVPTSTTSAPSTTVVEKMPDLVGQTEAQAKAELTRLGIKDVRTETQENLKQAGTVLEQVPRAGGEVSGSVNLIVASALSPMPDYKGRLVGDVRSWFKERGVELRTVSELRDDVADGTILSSTPNPNEPIGGEVILRVSEKPVTMQLSNEEPVEEKCLGMYTKAGDIGVNGATQQNSVYAILSNTGNSYTGTCAIDFNLARDWETFKAIVGIADTSASAQSARFEVFVDGNPAFNQTLGLGQTAEVSVDVKDALRLQLRVTDMGTGKLEAVYGNARLIGSATKAAEATTTTTTARR